MSRLTQLLAIILLLLSYTSDAQVQYVDTLIDSYYSGSAKQFDYFYGVGPSGDLTLLDPSICLGNNPWFVSISKDSYLTVGFTNNAIFDAPNQDDIFIQEEGSADELADIFISSDMGVSFTYFGQLNGGSTNALDLADIGFTGLVNAIKIVGLDNNGAAPGFDLVRIYGIEGANCEADANISLPTVCADSTINLLAYSEGTWRGDGWNGTEFLVSDTGYFQLTHIVEDVFAPCPNDTALVEIHVTPCGCDGTPYGEKVLDICGECLKTTDSLFNKSCIDCANVPFGESTLDLCQKCILPNSPEACTVDNMFYMANAFSPNGDGTNDFFSLNVRPGVTGQIINFMIFDRWGAVVFHESNLPLRTMSHWWDGTSQGQYTPIGVYIYSLKIQLEQGNIIVLSGDITLVR